MVGSGLLNGRTIRMVGTGLLNGRTIRMVGTGLLNGRTIRMVGTGLLNGRTIRMVGTGLLNGEASTRLAPHCSPPDPSMRLVPDCSLGEASGRPPQTLLCGLRGRPPRRAGPLSRPSSAQARVGLTSTSRASSPLTKRGLSSVESSVARPTHSLMATGSGTSVEYSTS